MELACEAAVFDQGDKAEIKWWWDNNSVKLIKIDINHHSRPSWVACSPRE